MGAQGPRASPKQGHLSTHDCCKQGGFEEVLAIRSAHGPWDQDGSRREALKEWQTKHHPLGSFSTWRLRLRQHNSIRSPNHVDASFEDTATLTAGEDRRDRSRSGGGRRDKDAGLVAQKGDPKLAEVSWVIQDCNRGALFNLLLVCLKVFLHV